MDIYHLKNAELEAKHQKYKGRVVLRGDTVKDDSGAYAAFLEQGSSASQITAAKAMDKQCMAEVMVQYRRPVVPLERNLYGHPLAGLLWERQLKKIRKSTNNDPMWKVLNKEVDLGEPTSFLDHVYLGCTQRQCEVSQNIVDNYRTMFESRISAG